MHVSPHQIMDSLAAYAALLAQYERENCMISPALASTAHHLLDQLVKTNQQIHPAWGPFQTLVDDFLCSVADLRVSKQLFKTTFSYFFRQQRFARAAGCFLRYSQRMIQKARSLPPQAEADIVASATDAAKALAIALTAAQLSKQQTAAEWGYSVAGAGCVLTQQLETRRYELLQRTDSDAAQAQQREAELREVEEQIQQINSQKIEAPVERHSIEEIAQDFAIWDSIVNLMGKPIGIQRRRTRFSVVKPAEAVKLAPIDVYLALLCRGDSDQALSLMQACGFSSALIIQTTVKQIITLVAQAISPEHQAQQAIVFTKQQNLAPFSILQGLDLQSFTGSQYYEDIKEAFQLLSDVLIMNRFDGQSTQLTFSPNQESEVFGAAVVAAHRYQNYQAVFGRFLQAWPGAKSDVHSLKVLNDLFKISWAGAPGTQYQAPPLKQLIVAPSVPGLKMAQGIQKPMSNPKVQPLTKDISLDDLEKGEPKTKIGYQAKAVVQPLIPKVPMNFGAKPVVGLAQPQKIQVGLPQPVTVAAPVQPAANINIFGAAQPKSIFKAPGGVEKKVQFQ